MSDLYKMGRDIIQESMPKLIPNFWGLSVKLSRLVFSLRLEKKWSQEDLANVLNVEKDVIIKIESGNKDISIGLYEKTLLALGMSYEEMDEIIS